MRRKLGIAVGVIGALLMAVGYVGAMLAPDRAGATLPWLIPEFLGVVPLIIGLHAWIDWKKGRS